jgi:biotin synthase
MNNTKWNAESIAQLFDLPFMELLYQAQTIHRQHFTKPEMELCTLLNIKTGACPENCGYCPQSAHFDTGLQKEKLWDVDDVVSKAKIAKASGSQRFCMGAAWRSPPKKMLPRVIEMIKAVKAEGLETCVTLGMLDAEDAQLLKDAGLDYYNHNLDTSPEFYDKIITTRTYQDRIDTLHHVHDAGINVCCGGILGMGETRSDRIGMLLQLTLLPAAPKSIPINKLIPIAGTPLANATEIDNFEFIRMIAVTRIMMPTSMIRLSAGREDMSDEMQTLCFMAGANSIFFGEKLLTAKNPEADKDLELLNKLGLTHSLSQNSTTASCEH